MCIHWKRFDKSNIVEDIISIIALFLGIIGQIFLILSYYFPWGSTYTCDMNNGCWTDRISFSSFFFYGSVYMGISFLIESVFWLMITIGLALIWWRKQLQIFSSLITIGILILPIKGFFLLLFFIKYQGQFCWNMIPEYFVRGCWNDFGVYMNLTAIILNILMVGLSILGLVLRKKEKDISRGYDVKGISIVSFCSFLVVSPVFFSNYSYSESGRLYPHIFFIIISITLLLTNFIKDKHSRNIIIPLFITILGIGLFLPLLPLLQFPEHHYPLNLGQFFIIQTSFVLIILGLLLFNNGSNFKLKDQKNLVSHRKRNRIFNLIFLVKLLSGAIIILLVYCLETLFSSDSYNNYLVLKNNPQAIIFLGVLTPFLMTAILYSLIHGTKDKRLEAHNRNVAINLLFPYVYFIGVLTYIYIVFYVFYFPFVSVRIKEIFNPFTGNIIPAFISIDLITIFCVFAVPIIYLNILKIKKIKKRLSVY